MKILVVDDSTLTARMMARMLRNAGHPEAEIVHTYEAAVQAIKAKDFDLLITDYHLELKTGKNVVDDAWGDKPFVLMSGLMQDTPAEFRSRAKALLEKPFAMDDVLLAMRAVQA